MKKMKNVIAIGLVAIMMSSCATVFGGKVTDSQKRKPLAGEKQREVRVGALIADIILFWPGLIVDFATGAIYKPGK
jgi:PBP1b-binding outer membrane lipoprotein LpoB